MTAPRVVLMKEFTDTENEWFRIVWIGGDSFAVEVSRQIKSNVIGEGHPSMDAMGDPVWRKPSSSDMHAIAVELCRRLVHQYLSNESPQSPSES